MKVDTLATIIVLARLTPGSSVIGAGNHIMVRMVSTRLLLSNVVFGASRYMVRVLARLPLSSAVSGMVRVLARLPLSNAVVGVKI